MCQVSSMHPHSTRSGGFFNAREMSMSKITSFKIINRTQ
ncbi:hypothetical protein SPAB_02255 [Salmonella enterica subsp. enterica serovar Paratyphi B str. SPB7]|uniref:Uncharacterized protein n=1 Tax=Salmonella paratyphi B (strain ATCC BAA-1250 / SPB7) TaxID=1016998 RepID=A0A6C6Z1X7_SALPB|nr:hypothetical protein SPAB_02255 [Salmonella enterica subsp. enterica serovar Paratyphi B str. SPB7]